MLHWYILLHFIILHNMRCLLRTFNNIPSHHITLMYIDSQILTVFRFTSHHVTSHHIICIHIVSHLIAAHRITSHPPTGTKPFWKKWLWNTAAIRICLCRISREKSSHRPTTSDRSNVSKLNCAGYQKPILNIESQKTCWRRNLIIIPSQHPVSIQI